MAKRKVYGSGDYRGAEPSEAGLTYEQKAEPKWNILRSDTLY